MRFEAKHNFFKRIVRNLNNFKNILVTLSTPHQLMEAYYLASPHYFGQTVVENVTTLNVSLLSPSVVKSLPDTVLSSTSTCITVTDKVMFDGTHYCSNMFVAIPSENSSSVMAQIQSIIIDGSNVLMLVRIHDCNYQSHIGSYKVTATDEYQTIHPSTLSDYYPLPAYSHGEGKVIVLKHYVSIKQCEVTASTVIVN